LALALAAVAASLSLNDERDERVFAVAFHGR
jgi:hypothetical protein